MIKIGIINNGPKFNWGKNFGYWFYVKYFINELRDYGFDIVFYDNYNKKFYDSDFIILDSRLFSDTVEQKIRSKLKLNKRFNYIESLIKILNYNKNIVWLDNTDSSGTTSFEILPYVKKYVKKQFYRDKNLYRKNFFRGRYYSDYYQQKFNLEKNQKFYSSPLPQEDEDKLVLGWNIGVGNYFDVLRYGKFKKFKCILSFLYKKNYKELYKYTLEYHNSKNKDQEVFYKFNLRENEKKKSIHFQRNEVNKILNKRFNLLNNRINHREYLQKLKNSKISVGAFGWGEVCYREFEAIKMGAAIIFPNMNYLETWPNIYQDNFSYLSYELDFSNLNEKIDILLNDENLRQKLVKNSKLILSSVYSTEGLDFLVNFFRKITR